MQPLCQDPYASRHVFVRAAAFVYGMQAKACDAVLYQAKSCLRRITPKSCTAGVQSPNSIGLACRAGLRGHAETTRSRRSWRTSSRSQSWQPGSEYFRKERDFAAFERNLHEGLQRFQIELYCYPLMFNHCHLVLRPLIASAIRKGSGLFY